MQYKLVRPKIRGKRSDTWYISWAEGRLSKRRSTGCTSLADAERWLADYIDERARPVDRVTVNEVIDARLADLQERGAASHYEVQAHLKAWRNAAGNLTWDQLTTEFIAGTYKVWRNDGKTDGTIRTRALHLRAALNLAERRRWIDKSPYIDAPPPGDARTRYLTRDEFEKLYAVAEEPHIRTFLALGVWTGMRSGAILDLTWNHIDRDRLMIHPQGGNRNKRRANVPINQPLALALSLAWELREGLYVVQWRGRKIGSVKTGFHAAVGRAELEDVNIHDLRRTCASWLAIAGVPLDRIAMILGDSVKMVQKHYAHLAPDYLRGEMDAIM